jgi:hypothetical protein
MTRSRFYLREANCEGSRETRRGEWATATPIPSEWRRAEPGFLAVFSELG